MSRLRHKAACRSRMLGSIDFARLRQVPGVLVGITLQSLPQLLNYKVDCYAIKQMEDRGVSSIDVPKSGGEVETEPDCDSPVDPGFWTFPLLLFSDVFPLPRFVKPAEVNHEE